MNQRLCLDLAGRIDAALLRELGEGIDLARTIGEPLYQRDVLLVCEAFEGTELAKLARDFRRATSDSPAETAAAAAAGADSSGFHPSKLLNSLFGALGGGSHAAGTPAPPHGRSKGRQRGGFGRWGSR